MHADAVAGVVRRQAEEGPVFGEIGLLLDEARGEAARLLRADPRNVALLRSTSEGMELVASGLDWRDGDEVILYERDFVACTAPFTRLPGVVVRWIPDRGDRFDLADVAALFGPRTRALCVSAVNRTHGMRAPLAELGALCREHGTWFAVDAAQAMGVLDLDVASADVVAAHGYKFLCSGFGLAVAWCSDRAIRELRPPLVGWKNADPAGDATRFEPSLPSPAALAGLAASLALLNGEELEAPALRMADLVAGVLRETGAQIVGRSVPEERSAVVVARGVEVLNAACATVEDGVRLSTHAFTSEDDVRALRVRRPR